MEFPPEWTAPPSVQEWTPFHAPRELSFQGVSEVQLAQNSSAWEVTGPAAAPPSAPGADYRPQWGVGKGRVSRCGYFPMLETCLAFGVSGPHLRFGPQGAALGGAGLSLRLALSLWSYSFWISRSCFPLLGTKRAEGGVRWRGLERTSAAPGTPAGKAPRPLPCFHPARRGRESPRGSSHPRGFSPVAGDFAPGAQPLGAAFRRAGACGTPALL